MTELAPSNQDAIQAMQDAMRAMPQAPAFKTEHVFFGGMYCRRMEIPKDSLIVSKVHKSDHLFIGCSGELVVAGQGEMYTLRAGDVIPSYIGTKRAVYALTDVVCMTVHKTDKTTTDGLEDELMAVNEADLYDVNNCPKPGVLTVSDFKKVED